MHKKKFKPVKGAFNWILHYTRREIKWVAALSVITGAISFGFIWLALVSKRVLDIATGDTEGSLWFAGLELLLVICFQAALNIVYNNIAIRALGRGDIAIKQGVFEKLLKKKWSELNAYHSGELINRFTSDVDVIINGVVDIVPTAIALITRLIAGLAVLFMIDARFTLIALGVGVFVFVAAKLYSKHFKYLHKLLQTENGKVRSFLQECFENIIVIKSFASDDIVKDRLDSRQKNALKVMYKKQTVSNVANTGVYVLFTGSYYAALIWGAVSINAGTLTFGTLTAFLQIIDQIKGPMANISGLVPKFYACLASAERLMELEELPDEDRTSLGECKKLYDELEGIELRAVDFAYKDEVVLKNASAFIKKGEFTAITGASGSGKSTIIKLILNLIEPDRGEILLKLISGEKKLNSACRELFAYVPQGNMVLSGTMRENIAFCRPDASDEAITAAAEKAMLGELLASLENGLDTQIGERGLGLSEGQTQRLAVARALLSGAPILLLDEATSALDEKTEAELLQNLRSMEGKTCIFISHRTNTLKLCDKIIEFDGKTLTEKDTV